MFGLKRSWTCEESARTGLPIGYRLYGRSVGVDQSAAGPSARDSGLLTYERVASTRTWR